MSKEIRILTIMQCIELGGMEKNVYSLMDWLHRKGSEFKVISLHPLGLGQQVLNQIGVPTARFPYRGTFGLLSHHLVRREVQHQWLK
jgi:hypothetical protein